jgi:DnaK suppressor protein
MRPDGQLKRSSANGEKSKETMTKSLTSQNRREFIVKAREHLKTMRIALIHELASDIRAGRSVSSGGALDSGDLASQENEQYMAVIRAERQSGRIAQIDHALKRIDQANYGVCTACGFEIAEARLEAMPFTQHCRDCQGDHEREGEKWRPAGDIEQERFAGFDAIAHEKEIN